METTLTSIQRRITGEPVQAELHDDIADKHLEQWRDTWAPFANTAASAQKKPGRSMPEDLHWDWGKKTEWSRNLWALQRFALTSEGELQGLMLLNLAKYSKLPNRVGRHVAYIEFLATAPWNRPDFVDEPRYRGIGLAMVRAAIEVSRSEDFKGRVGLHSLPQAAAFYRNVCQMTEVGPDPNYDGLVYFEMTEAQADTFCAP